MDFTSNAMRHLPTALGTILLILAGIYTVGCAPENDASSDVADTAEAEVDAAAAEEGSLQRPPRVGDETRESPNATTSQAIGTAEITITYGRPAVKDRDVFGGLEPYGDVWRAGANEATVFHTTDDVTINGEPLPAGVYSLFAIPNPDTWTLIFNRTAEQWGAFDYAEEADALRVEATPESGPHNEWLDYSFEDLSDTAATAVLHWSTTRVPFTIAVAE